MKRVAIIGAGITGITSAYALLKHGYEVTVFDRNRYPAMETSFANGGQLSASNAEVWNQTATVLKGIKWMTQRNAPLLVNPTPSWHKLSWMAEFVANIRSYESNTIETTKLAIAAREHLFAWARDEDIDFNHETRGILHIYPNKKGFEHATRVNKLLSAGGLERRAVTPQEMKTIEPALTQNYFGGYFTPSDSTGDIHRFTRGLADACVAKGAQLQQDSRVTTLKRENNGVTVTWAGAERNTPDPQSHFDAIVICAGVGSRALAAQLGDRVNVYPVKGYSITVNLNDVPSRESTPWVSLLDDDAKIVTSRLGEDRFRVAGTAEFNGANRDIRADRIAPLVNWCRDHFPTMNADQVIPWAGLRPMLPSMMPRVGQGRQSAVFYNTGHGHLGWTLSAATAQMVASEVHAQLSAKPTVVSIPGMAQAQSA